MKFLSGTRNRSITYVIEPARPITDMATGRSIVTPALRAVFTDHKFNADSRASYVMYREYANAQVQNQGRLATDEEVEAIKAKVEKYLLSHEDFGRSGDGRGIFLDNTATLTDAEMRGRGAVRRCLFMQDLGEETVQCEQQVDDPESDYCQAHRKVLETVVGGTA